MPILLKNMTMCACLLAIIAIGCFTSGCKKRFDPPHSEELGYLVVEGLINSGQGPTNIKLSRTIRLDTTYSSYELKAVVRVEDEHNNFYPLTEKGQGLYSISQLHLSDNEKYRLRIKTAGGSEYVSDYSPVLRTPRIDSISLERVEKGLTLFANTHNLQNTSISYRWAFEETWEFHSRYRSLMQFVINPLNGNVADITPRPDSVADKMFYCWKTEESGSIVSGNAVNLNRDTIHLPITTIPAASWKLSVLYSINVKQYAMTQPEYEFWQRMKKNTEQIGTIFDPQPSALTTNLHCLTNPSEMVIGFIGVADEQQKRIFIRNSEVPGWNYQSLCEKGFIELDPDILNQFKDAIPIIFDTDPGDGKLKLVVTSPECGDCKTRGVNVKPSFWP